MYTEIIEIIWKNENMTLKVAELVEGEPNGYIGLPLVINEKSKIFEVTLSNVFEFKSVTEPFFCPDGEERKINDFVWEAIGSEYIKTAGFYGPTPETARHFIIFSERIVFEALCETEPVIRVISV
jgi:hypothetical protein